MEKEGTEERGQRAGQVVERDKGSKDERHGSQGGERGEGGSQKRSRRESKEEQEGVKRGAGGRRKRRREVRPEPRTVRTMQCESATPRHELMGSQGCH